MESKERFGHKDPKVSEFNSYGFDIHPKPLRPLVKLIQRQVKNV